MKEVNFLDRVPTYPGRVVLTPVPGQANTFDMERADAPVVAGTPLDKATFNSIVHSRLTGRYYEPVVARAQFGAAIVATANFVPASGWTNNSFSRSTSGAFIVTANADGGNYPSYVFDNNNDTYWQGAEGLAEHWLILELPEATAITRVSVKIGVDSPTVTPTIRVQGSNNKSSWENLGTIPRTQTFVEQYELTNPGEYKYYRLHLSYAYNNIPYIYTFGVAQYEVKEYANAFTLLDEVPAVWEEGQRITVQIPSETNTFGVVQNSLNGIKVNTILQPDRRYELRYDGSAFVAKEV